MKTLLAIVTLLVTSVVAAPVPVAPTNEIDGRQIWGGNPPYWKRDGQDYPIGLVDGNRPDGYWRDDTRLYWKREWPKDHEAGGIWIPGPVFWRRKADASASADAQSGGIWGGVPPHWKRTADADAGLTPDVEARQSTGYWGGVPPHWKRTAEAEAGPTSDVESRQSTGYWGGVPPHWKRTAEAQAGPTSDIESRQSGGIWGGVPPHWKRDPEVLITALNS